MKKLSKTMLSLTLAGCVITPNLVTIANAQENDSQDKAVATAAATTSNKRIVTYFPSWGTYQAGQQNIEVKDIAWDKVTHINHGFFEITNDFNIQTTDAWADYDNPNICPAVQVDWNKYPATGVPEGTVYGHFGAYKYYSEKYPDVKILISVGGWTRSEKFSDAALTEANRKTLANNMVAFMKKYPFIDGMDIDWEYPCVTRSPEDQYDRGCVGRPEDKENFTLLLKTMRETFDANGMSDKLVTCAVNASEGKTKLTEPDKYYQYCDYIALMTYDFAGGWNDITGHLAPIYTNPNDPLNAPNCDRENLSLDFSMTMFRDVYNVPSDKLLGGTPLYSRGWGSVEAGPNGDGLWQSGGNFKGNLGEGGQYSYYDVAALEKTAGWTKYFDKIAKVPYLYNASLKQFVTYEDETSLKIRCNYINKNNYGGLIVWDASGEILNGYPMHTIMEQAFKQGKIFTDVDDTVPDVPVTPDKPDPTYAAEDVNQDGVVDLKDLTLVADKYGVKKADSNYDAKYDVNSDGVINIVDIVKVALKMDSATEPTNPTEPDNPTEDTSNDTYDATKVYNSGDTVVYKGVTYKAQWWTQGEEPGTSSVWVEVN